MQYSEGQLGRVFVVRIDNGEDFLVTLQKFIGEKEIETGTILFLGALKEGRLVTGPEELTFPPSPHFVMFEGGWETFGIGTICQGDAGPAIHYHASFGRAGHALTGCLRELATTYLIIEAVILEFTGFGIHREMDEATKMSLPFHEKYAKAEGVKEKKIQKKTPEPEKKESPENPRELPGGLAEIIRDLTRRPSR